MPLIRQTLRDIGFDSLNLREGIVPNRSEIDSLGVDIPLSQINQQIPNDSIDWNKASIKTLQIGQYVRSGYDVGYNSGTGWWIGVDTDGVSKFFFGNASADKVTWNGTTLNITGSLIAGDIHIPDEDTTANSFHVNTTGNSWWGCTSTNFAADNNNANAYILATGVAKFQNVTIAGSNSDIQSAVKLDGNVTAGRVNSWTEPWANQNGNFLALTNDYWIRTTSGFTDVETYFFNNDYLNNYEYREYRANFRANALTASNYCGILCNFDTISNIAGATGHYIQLDFAGNNVTFVKFVAGVQSTVKNTAFTFSASRYYDLTVRIYDNSTTPWMRVFIDGKQIFEINNTDYTPSSKEGYYGVRMMTAQPRMKDFTIGGTTEIYGDLVVNGEITAAKITVSTLSAIAADLGTITAGTITGATFQTSATANTGIKFDSTSLRGYDASNKEVFTLDPSTGKATVKDLAVINGNVWIPSFYAPDEAGTNSLIGNGDNSATIGVARYLDGAISLYNGYSYLKSRLVVQNKNGTGATNTASMLGTCYNASAGFFIRSLAGGNVVERVNDGAATTAWTQTLGSLIQTGAYGIDTDGTRVWVGGAVGGPSYYLYNLTYSGGAVNGNSVSNLDFGGQVGIVYYNSFVYVFTSNGGASKIYKYDTANTPALQATTTLSDDAFQGLLVFRVDNTGRVYCLPNAVYNTSNRSIHYLLDLNDL